MDSDVRSKLAMGMARRASALLKDPAKNTFFFWQSQRPADFRSTGWKVCWSLVITERLSPISNHRKRVNDSGEEKVVILRAQFVEGLLQEHVQLKKANGDP